MIKKIKFVWLINKINGLCAEFNLSEDDMFFVYQIMVQPFFWKKFKNVLHNRYCKCQTICASLLVLFNVFANKKLNLGSFGKFTKAVTVSVSSLCKLSKEEAIAFVSQIKEFSSQKELYILPTNQYIQHICNHFAPAIYLSKTNNSFYEVSPHSFRCINFSDMIISVSELSAYLNSIADYSSSQIKTTPQNRSFVDEEIRANYKRDYIYEKQKAENKETTK